MYMMDGTETNTQALAALDENTRSVLSNAQIKTRHQCSVFYIVFHYYLFFS